MMRMQKSNYSRREKRFVGVLTCLLGISCFAFGAHAQERANEKEVARFSLHLGVNQAPVDSSLSKLHYADDDAWRMHQFFAKQSVHSEWLTVLDAQTRRREVARHLEPMPPTKAQLAKALQRLRTRMKAQSASSDVELVVTFAGHGVVKDGKVQLAMLDGFLSKSFFDDLATWPEVSRLHLIIDACHAGGLFNGRGFRSSGAAVVTQISPSFDAAWFSRRPHVGALLGSSANGLAHEWSRIEGGLFTHEVLSALRGAADVDGDQKVTYDEVAAFSALAKSTLADPVTAGQVLSYPPAQAPFAALSLLAHSDEGHLQIPPNSRLWVRHDDGRNLMHVHTGSNSGALVLLPLHTELVLVDEQQRQAVFSLASPVVVDASIFAYTAVRAARDGDEGPQKGWLRRPFTSDFFLGWQESKTQRRVQVASVANVGVTHSEEQRAWIPIIGLGAVGAFAGVAMVASGAWMATAAQAYNETEYEKSASNAEVDHFLAMSGVLLFGAVAVAAAGGAAFLWGEPLLMTSDGS